MGENSAFNKMCVHTLFVYKVGLLDVIYWLCSVWGYFSPDELCLTNGSFPGEGIVELLLNGKRGRVCSNRVPNVFNLTLLCNQLGYRGLEQVFKRPGNIFANLTNVNYVVTEVDTCPETVQYIWECNTDNFEGCGLEEYLAIRCNGSRGESMFNFFTQQLLFVL